MKNEDIVKELVKIASEVQAESTSPLGDKSYLIKRLISNLPKLADLIQDALDKYESDPEKMAPQLDNLKTAIWQVYKLSRMVLMALGEKEVK